MRNIHTLLYFMKYFEPHCVRQDGKTTCYVSMLEYPDPEEALAVLGGDGLSSGGPNSIILKHARYDPDAGGGRWDLQDVETAGSYPVWVAW